MAPRRPKQPVTITKVPEWQTEGRKAAELLAAQKKEEARHAAQALLDKRKARRRERLAAGKTC